jgi:hypothetical protein
VFVVEIIKITSSFSIGVSATHTNIASDTNTATLLGKDSTELCALSQAWEAFGRENCEWSALDF